MDFMTIFDLIVGVLGVYLTFSGLKNFKDGTVDVMLITAQEMTKCKDVQGLSKFLMPKQIIFGLCCIVFGIQGFLCDAKVLQISDSIIKTVNVVFLILFVLVWIMFSYFINRAKKNYIGD